MRKFFKRIFLILLFAIAFFGSYFIHEGYEVYQEAIAKCSVEQKAQEIKSEVENYTEISVVPQNYINAVVAVEDRRFYKHHGIDIVSIGRAIAVDIKTLSLKEGGSTITQQLAKNVYFSQKRELTRKIAEMFMAKEIENSLSKDEILELYINTCYFGNGYYCIADAADGYFDKEVKDMNLYDCSLLAGIPNAPSVYAPTVNLDLALQRQKKVLKCMKTEKYISEEQYNEVLKEEYSYGK